MLCLAFTYLCSGHLQIMGQRSPTSRMCSQSSSVPLLALMAPMRSSFTHIYSSHEMRCPHTFSTESSIPKVQPTTEVLIMTDSNVTREMPLPTPQKNSLNWAKKKIVPCLQCKLHNRQCLQAGSKHYLATKSANLLHFTEWPLPYLNAEFKAPHYVSFSVQVYHVCQWPH